MANPEHVAIIKRGTESWNKWREENLGIKPDLSASNLYEAYLSRANLSRANLSKANLSGAYLVGADLRESDLRDTNLSEASLFRANLSRANLSGADLKETHLGKANLSGADLSRTNFSGVNLFKHDFRDVNLREVRLNGANLREVEFRTVRLGGADLRDAKFRKTDLRKADLRKADLKKADLNRQNLSGANLSGADLTNADLREVNFTNADLREAILREANLRGANLTNANLTGACILDWVVNSKTSLTDVQCDYIYFGWDVETQQPTDRRPHNPNEIFAPGDFARLIEQSRATVDLIFSNGIDWGAFLTSFQTLQVAGEQGELSIQGINKKSDGSFVISVDAPQTADKGAIEKEFWAKYQPMLEAQDHQIAFYEQQIQKKDDLMMEIFRTMAAKDAVKQDFYGPVDGVAGQTDRQIVNIEAKKSDR